MNPFYSKLLLSFIVGGIFVGAITILAERFGSRIGGVLAGFPSTVAISLIFIALATSPQEAAHATDVIPILLGVFALFMVAYSQLAKHGLAVGLCSSLVLWFVLAYCLVVAGTPEFGISLLICGSLLVVCFWLLHRQLDLPVCGDSSVHLNIKELLFRSTFSGSIIALAVFLSKVSGPVLGGVFAVFPAATVATVIITARTRGVEFTRSLVKPWIVSGVVNCCAYTIVIRAAYPTLGVTLGTTAAFAVASITALGTYWFISATCRSNTRNLELEARS